MSLVVTFLKNIWPKLTFGGRTTIGKTTYLTDSTASLMTDSSGEVLTDSSI